MGLPELLHQLVKLSVPRMTLRAQRLSYISSILDIFYLRYLLAVVARVYRIAKELFFVSSECLRFCEVMYTRESSFFCAMFIFFVQCLTIMYMYTCSAI